MHKKISIIGTVGLPAKYGGFETLAEHLVENLADKFKLTVYCSSKAYTDKIYDYKGAKLKYINFNANGLQSIVYDGIAIIKAIKNSDTLLILGVSGCIILPIIRIFTSKKILINIDGLEWKRDKWNGLAKLFLKYSEHLAVKYADTIIADNKVIEEYVFESYGKQSKMIPYGADHVFSEKISSELLTKNSFLKHKYAFKVCRIEPENNIHLILEAFKEYIDLNLVIIGNWNANSYSKELSEKYAKVENIHLLDPIYNQSILNSIRSNCYIYVHGHSAGGTNPSLVEAMYLGLPILSFGVEYNKETTKNKAIYFNSKEELIDSLTQLNDSLIHELSENMREIALLNYTWDKIADQYAQLF